MPKYIEGVKYDKNTQISFWVTFPYFNPTTLKYTNSLGQSPYVYAATLWTWARKNIVDYVKKHIQNFPDYPIDIFAPIDDLNFEGRDRIIFGFGIAPASNANFTIEDLRTKPELQRDVLGYFHQVIGFTNKYVQEAGISRLFGPKRIEEMEIGLSPSDTKIQRQKDFIPIPLANDDFMTWKKYTKGYDNINISNSIGVSKGKMKPGQKQPKNLKPSLNTTTDQLFHDYIFPS